MSIREVKAFFAARGMEGRVLEFDTSSATVELAAQTVGGHSGPHRQNTFLYDAGRPAAGGNGRGRQNR